MILAINCRNIISSEAIISTGDNSVIFKEFLNRLATILGHEGHYTIVMDNVRFHHSDPDFYDSYPYQIKWLPSSAGTNDDISRMMEECGRIMQETCPNYIHHFEQFFRPCLNEEDIGRE
ncbi:hypothetical protein RF11_15002 [Thelohanellus kitauei]|uniref:Tc1-like transposase DDE domain-containing protein n=1 Tax=Thelohanellus kitauei TaxID=669202 RepID=A0A0C2IEP5_THEKT|nr:hypothetical protein RF11_15002 [Thelohanellus kitauei]